MENREFEDDAKRRISRAIRENRERIVTDWTCVLVNAEEVVESLGRCEVPGDMLIPEWVEDVLGAGLLRLPRVECDGVCYYLVPYVIMEQDWREKHEPNIVEMPALNILYMIRSLTGTLLEEIPKRSGFVRQYFTQGIDSPSLRCKSY